MFSPIVRRALTRLRFHGQEARPVPDVAAARPSTMLRYSIPIATVLFSLLTVQTRIDVGEGHELSLYGFPLPWHRWSEVSSLEFVVDPAALFLDYLVYVLVCSALLRSAPGRALVARCGPTHLLVAWAAAVVALGWLRLMLLSFTFGDVDSWPFYRVISLLPHLGFHYPYV